MDISAAPAHPTKINKIKMLRVGLCLRIAKQGHISCDWLQKLTTTREVKSTKKSCISNIKTKASDSAKIPALEAQIENGDKHWQEDEWAEQGRLFRKLRSLWLKDVHFPGCAQVGVIGSSKVLIHNECDPFLFIRVPVSIPQPSYDSDGMALGNQAQTLLFPTPLLSLREVDESFESSIQYGIMQK